MAQSNKAFSGGGGKNFFSDLGIWACSPEKFFKTVQFGAF